MLEGLDPITLTLGDFSDQKLHDFLQKLDAAANQLRPRLMEHQHADPHLSHPHQHEMRSAHAHPNSGNQQGWNDKSRQRGDGDVKDHMARMLDQAVAGLGVLARVDGDGCSLALTGQELIVADEARGTRREKLAHVLGVRNSPTGDLEIEMAGGLPIPIHMAKMPPEALSKFFATMTPLTQKNAAANSPSMRPRTSAQGNAERGDLVHTQRTGSSDGGKPARVFVDPMDEAQWKIDTVGAAELQVRTHAHLCVSACVRTHARVNARGLTPNTSIRASFRIPLLPPRFKSMQKWKLLGPRRRAPSSVPRTHLLSQTCSLCCWEMRRATTLMAASSCWRVSEKLCVTTRVRTRSE